jgi:predicted aspartyl protease
MGMFQVKVKVANPSNPELFFEEDFWVDTGALYSFIPEDKLREIGITPLHSREEILADGRRDRRLLGSALFTLKEPDETLPTLVMFGLKDSLYLLGAMALEGFSVEVDPVEKKLKPIAAIICSLLVSDKI